MWRETFSVYFCSKYNEYFFYLSFVVYTTERQVFWYLITVHYVQSIVIFMAKMGSDKTCARDIVTEGVALQ